MAPVAADQITRALSHGDSQVSVGHERITVDLSGRGPQRYVKQETNVPMMRGQERARYGSPDNAPEGGGSFRYTGSGPPNCSRGSESEAPETSGRHESAELLTGRSSLSGG